MARKSAQEIIQRTDALISERSNLDATLDLIERFIRPGRGRMWQTEDSEMEIDWRRGREVYDGTAILAASFLASNLQSYLSSSSTPWYDIGFQDTELAKVREARLWVEDGVERHRKAYASSTLYEELPEMYFDGVSFGTAFIEHVEKEPPSGRPATVWRGHQFKTEAIKNTYFEESIDGELIGFYRVRHYTPLQLALKFGMAALPGRLRGRVAKAEQEEVECIYAVYLDSGIEPDPLTPAPPDRRPYVGRWVLRDSSEFIGDEVGYYEMPGYCWRWARMSDSRYGYGPGMIALSDVLTLQDQVWMRRTATEKVVDPPMKATRRGVLGSINHGVGKVTIVRDMNQPQPLMPPGAYQIREADNDIADLRNRIDRAFFVDQLLMKESPEMTAQEVRVRYEIMQRLLGPNVGRARTDVFDRMHKRAWFMMMRKGAIPPMPAVVAEAGADFELTYNGPLARAERLDHVEITERWLGLLRGMSEMPGGDQLADVPEWDTIARESAEILGVPTRFVGDDMAVRKRRQERIARLQQAMAAEQAAKLGQAAHGLGRSGLMDMAGRGANGNAQGDAGV